MRRAMRHAHILGASKDPLMHRLALTLVAEMARRHFELRRAEATIVETLRQEEVRFLRRARARDGAARRGQRGAHRPAPVLPGETAFRLYDTYGFPLDLTQDALRSQELISVDTAGFDAAMDRQRKMARGAWTGSGSAG